MPEYPDTGAATPLCSCGTLAVRSMIPILVERDVKVDLYSSTALPLSRQPFECVERKGLGHPDSICDSVMEAAAAALRREYVERCGRVLHHNLDKALLVAGRTEPGLGGGKVVEPIQIIAGDRAISVVGDVRIPVDDIVDHAV